MNSGDAGAERVTQPPDEATGIPRLRSWRAVYAFVLGTFGATVALLAWFTHLFAR